MTFKEENEQFAKEFRRRNSDGNVHTMPLWGQRHDENENCWCEPQLNFVNEETGIKHFIHKGYTELEQ